MDLLVLLQEESRVIHLPMKDLVSLENAISGGELAMRELDENHVQDLVNSEVSSWSAIKVAPSTIGPILIDGYHRQEAATRKGETHLAALVQSYATVNDVVEAAFRANLTHGLKASEETRGDYAFWLHVTYPNLTQAEIAERAHISQPAVSKAITKREALLRDTVLEEMGIKKQFDAQQACKQFSRWVIKFVADIETMNDDELIKYMQAAVKKERNKLAYVGRLLVQAYGE